MKLNNSCLLEILKPRIIRINKINSNDKLSRTNGSSINIVILFKIKIISKGVKCAIIIRIINKIIFNRVDKYKRKKIFNNWSDYPNRNRIEISHLKIWLSNRVNK